MHPLNIIWVHQTEFHLELIISKELNQISENLSKRTDVKNGNHFK